MRVKRRIKPPSNPIIPGMLQYCPLASGSKGNCLVVQTPETTILVDCGISLRSIQARLANLEISLESIDAIFITHEHTDHIQGLRSFLNKHPVPVICNRETAAAIGQAFREAIPCHLFTSGDSFIWRDLHCLPFNISHDAIDPVGYRFSWNDQHLAICADLGYVHATLLPFLSGCQMLYIESNHEPHLVELSKRPPLYKQRVLGKLGHLSNQACAQLLRQIWHRQLRHVHLAHLSRDCNRPELALQISLDALEEIDPDRQTTVEIAHQDVAGSLVSIHGVLQASMNRSNELLTGELITEEALDDEPFMRESLTCKSLECESVAEKNSTEGIVYGSTT